MQNVGDYDSTKAAESAIEFITGLRQFRDQ